MNSRRQFILQSIPAVMSLGVAVNVNANAQDAHVDEKSPAATALGYKHDGSKVDGKKYPAYAATKHCGNCALFQGKATDSWAKCAALGNKEVNAKGWCMAWAKKA